MLGLMPRYRKHCIAPAGAKDHAGGVARHSTTSSILFVVLGFAGAFVVSGVIELAWHLLKFGKAF